MSRSVAIVSDVLRERQRQDRLKAEGKFAYTCADEECSDELCAVVLGEEFGEVCRAVCDKNPRNLREELVQVAAGAVAWIEKLDKQRGAE